jgi:hypothetical protein
MMLVLAIPRYTKESEALEWRDDSLHVCDMVWEKREKKAILYIRYGGTQLGSENVWDTTPIQNLINFPHELDLNKT